MNEILCLEIVHVVFLMIGVIQQPRCNNDAEMTKAMNATRSPRVADGLELMNAQEHVVVNGLMRKL